MVKKTIALTILMSFFTFSAIAQTSNSTVRSITEALQDIARKNNAVENVIYDGMTYKQVCKILGDEFDVRATFESRIFEKGIRGVSFNGNYIIYWSNTFPRQTNPTVLGYSRVGSDDINHNILQ